MIYITGDTHGDYNDFMNRIRQHKISKGDIVIVCGDFGFVWDIPENRWSLTKLTAEPFTIVFVDGNHEDFNLLYTYPVIDWNGGKVHKIADNIYHLMRGQRFIIEGKSFFTMGGAYSTDKARRTEGKSWWKQELPDNNEYKIAEETLKSCNYEIDYVLTHTVPQSVMHYLGFVPDMHDAELTGYFEWLYGELKFKKWFAGHFHVNQLVKDNVQVLFDDILPIEQEQ